MLSLHRLKPLIRLLSRNKPLILIVSVVVIFLFQTFLAVIVLVEGVLILE